MKGMIYPTLREIKFKNKVGIGLGLRKKISAISQPHRLWQWKLPPFCKTKKIVWRRSRNKGFRLIRMIEIKFPKVEAKARRVINSHSMMIWKSLIKFLTVQGQ